MKLIRLGSLIALIGYVLSGPVGFMLVKFLQPQPQWVSAQVFVSHYHLLQDLPFMLGFLLIGGMLMVAAGHYMVMEGRHEVSGLLSFAITIVFATLITLNYISQTTFVRNLVIHYRPEFDSTISTFSMANPLSLAWSIEMWGYAFLGIATWLWAPFYKEKHRATSVLLVLNGIASIATAIVSLIDLGWVMTTAGLVGYMLWNGLMIALMILLYRHAAQDKPVNTIVELKITTH